MLGLPKKIPVVITTKTIAPGESRPVLSSTDEIFSESQITLMAVKQTFEDQGFNIKRTTKILPTISLDLTKDEILTFSKLSQVESIWLDFKIYSQLDTAIQVLDIPEIRKEYNVTGSGQSVHVLDVAMNLNHPNLKGSVIGSADLVNDNRWIDPTIEHHASHVGGIIASDHPTYKGVAPDTKLFSIKVLNSQGSGSMSTIIEGVDIAIKNKAKILNLSVGGLNPTCIGNCPVCRSIDNAADLHGITSVISAGNSGPLPYTICCPSKSERSITVAAVDDKGSLMWWSSRSGLLSLDKPDIAAPGNDIYSCSGDDGFINMSGTSMAGPYVAGIVSLMNQYTWDHYDRLLTPKETKFILKETAKGGLIYNSGSGLIDPSMIMNYLKNNVQ